MAGKRKTGGQTHIEYGFGGIVNHALWKTINAMGVPKLERNKEHESPQKIAQPHLTDDKACELIKRRLEGESLKRLHSEYGISYSSAYSLTTGMNRSHLLRKVQEGYEDIRYVSRKKKA